MTENTTPDPTPDPTPGATDDQQLEQLVPEGRDPLDDLTAGELGTIGRLLKCDPFEAVAGKGAGAGLRWPALAHIAWLWAKRRDPKAQLAPMLELRPAQLSAVLGLGEREPSEDEAPEANPTDYAPAS